VLLAASLVFYGLGEPVYIFLMLVAAGSAFGFAFLIDGSRGKRRQRVFLFFSVAVNVSFLLFFKYAPLFVDTVSALFRLDIRTPHIILPIGISFYTFQILTYTVDVFFGKTKLQRSPVKFLLYVTMFPQLIAGPIVRYNDVAVQLDKRHIDPGRFASGVIRFTCGLAKKVLLADYAAGIADVLLGASSGGAAYAGVENAAAVAGVAGGIREGLGMTGVTLGVGGMSTLGAWVGLIMFGFQIYFDFSGYSDMAIGLGRMFGFEFMENFKHPFSSKSITEFWRRWHMSLGTFFRDYVYIPLGGNRRYQLRNIAIVWVLTGLWHGASWNFVLWGSYFGAILIAEKYMIKYFRVKIPAPARWLYCFLAVTISWSIFYYTDLALVGETLRAMFIFRPEADRQIISLILDNLLFILVCFFAAMPWAKQIYNKILYWSEKKNRYAATVTDLVMSLAYSAALLIVSSTVRIASSYSPFIYFKF